MAFTLNGLRINQTGTDTSLAGLSGIAGVTTTVIGGVTYYNIGTLQFYSNPSAVLTINGRTERLITSYAPGSTSWAIGIGGTVTINDFDTVNGADEYFADEVMKSTYVNSFCCGNYGVRGFSGGTLTMNGGALRTGSSIQFDDGFTFVTTGSSAALLSDTVNSGSNVLQTRVLTDNFNIDGLFFKRFQYVPAKQPLPASSQFGVKVFGGSIACSGGLTGGIEYRLDGLDYAGIADYLIGVNDYNFIGVYNAGTDDLALRGTINNTRCSGLFRLYKTIQPSTRDLAKAAVPDSKLYIRDTNNGNRRNWTASNVDSDTVSINFVDDRIYSLTANASGVMPQTDVLTMVLARPLGSYLDATNAGLNTRDFRSLTGIPGDTLFNVLAYRYGYTIQNLEYALKGEGILDMPVTLFRDVQIASIDMSIPQAYTEITTAVEFYNRAALYLHDNYAGETSTIVSREGETITAGTYDVVIDAAAASVFAFDGTTITIKSSAYIGGITTTGTITVSDVTDISGSTFSSLNLTSGRNLTDITVSGTLAFNDNVSATFNLINCTINVMQNDGTGILTFNNTNSTVTDSTDTEINIVTPSTTYQLNFPNIIEGSRFQVYNVTQVAELTNTLSGVSGISEEYISGTDFNNGDIGRYRITYQSGVTAKLPIEGTFVFSDNSVNTLPITQSNDDAYNFYGIDGSLVTKFEPDYIEDQINLIVASNFEAKELYAFAVWILTTPQGINDFFGGFEALDVANIKINESIVNLRLDNNTAANVYQSDNIRVFRNDGNYPVVNPTTGGGGIDIVWRNQIFIAETGVSGLTSEESAKLLTIPTNPVIETDTRLNKLDVPISSRLATVDYTSPDNAGITEILTNTGTTIPAQITALNDPTVSEIQTGLATQASVDVIDSNIDAIKAKTDTLENTDLTGIKEDLNIINNGVKKASKIIPHKQNLTP